MEHMNHLYHDLITKYLDYSLFHLGLYPLVLSFRHSNQSRYDMDLKIQSWGITICSKIRRPYQASSWARGLDSC